MNDKATTVLNGSTPAAANQQPTASVPASSEVVPKAKRRTFSAEYKRRILREADQCRKHGDIGILLRREGLYSSHLTEWRKQAAAGQLAANGKTKRGPKPKLSAEQKETARLRRENARLEKRLAQAELIIAAQKKVAELIDLMRQQNEQQ